MGCGKCSVAVIWASQRLHGASSAFELPVQVGLVLDVSGRKHFNPSSFPAQLAGVLYQNACFLEAEILGSFSWMRVLMRGRSRS